MVPMLVTQIRAHAAFAGREHYVVVVWGTALLVR